MNIESMKLCLKALVDAQHHMSAMGAPISNVLDAIRFLDDAIEESDTTYERGYNIGYVNGAYETYESCFKKQNPVAFQDTAKHDELVSIQEWENIDPIWHHMYRPLYTRRERKPLNQKQINQLIKDAGYGDEQNEKISDFINGIVFAEAAHGIKE